MKSIDEIKLFFEEFLWIYDEETTLWIKKSAGPDQKQRDSVFRFKPNLYSHQAPAGSGKDQEYTIHKRIIVGYHSVSWALCAAHSITVLFKSDRQTSDRSQNSFFILYVW